MDAALRIDAFLFFEAEIGDALLEHSNKKVVGEMVLVGEAGRRDGFQPAKEFSSACCRLAAALSE